MIPVLHWRKWILDTSSIFCPAFVRRASLSFSSPTSTFRTDFACARNLPNKLLTNGRMFSASLPRWLLVGIWTFGILSWCICRKYVCSNITKNGIFKHTPVQSTVPECRELNETSVDSVSSHHGSHSATTFSTRHVLLEWFYLAWNKLIR